MIVSFIKRQARAATAALGLALMGFAAAPAAANNNNTAADIAAPVQNGQTAPLSGGDAKFRALFDNWQALDNGSTAAPAPAVSVPSRMPLGDAKLTSGYGMRNHPVTGGRRNHKGIDLAAPTGTPIYATADGVITRANWFSSYGLYISIAHGAQLETRYAHLSKLAVADGQQVKKGDIIGYVGSTGRSTGPHLHYEIRVAGKAVNPMPYMAESQAQKAFAEATANGGRGGQ